VRRRELLVALAVTAAPAPLYAAEGDKKKKSGGLTYIPIDTLTGTTTKASGRRGVLTVECGLDVPNGDLRALAEASLPRLRAAFVQTVIVYAAGLPSGQPPSADWLAMTLQRDTDQTLGKPGAKLLLGAILVN
jgi:hypothetical protein